MNGGAGGFLPTPSLAYTPDPWLVNWGPTYDSSRLSDNNPSTYWCAPSGTTFPIVTLLTLGAPSNLASIDFDARVSGYETSAIREVLIEPLAAGNVPLGAPVTAVLNANAITTVPVAASGAEVVRLTFRSNYGGSYAALSEIALRSDMGTGMPPLPALPVPPGVVSGTAPPGVVTGTAPPAVGAVVPVTGGVGLPYVLDASIPAFAGYGIELMHDGNPATYWCSPAAPVFPFIITLTLTPPGMVSAIEIDSTNATYTDIGPSDVTILAMSPTGTILNVTNGTATANTRTRIPLIAPVEAAQLRVTLQDHYGGSYVGISELAVFP